MSARKLKQVFPSVLFLVAAVVLMIIGIRSDNYWGYAVAAVASAIFGLILVMALQSQKHTQENEWFNAARKRKRKDKQDGLFGEDQYHLFDKHSKQNSKGSLDDLPNEDIDRKT